MARPAAILVSSSGTAPGRRFHFPAAEAWAIGVLVAGSGLVVYVTVRVMVSIPRLGRADVLRNWPMAVLGAAIVALVAAAVVSWATGRRRAVAMPVPHSQLSFALFSALVLIQVLHMIEHTAQVMELMSTNGDLDRSHGVIGRLDFETVHFVFDTGLWLALAYFVVLWRGDNAWLWIAFGFQSVHQVEHLYLFWLYQTHPALYAQGGLSGIMGSGGMVGSPLARPYLHFTYNLPVMVAMVVAWWYEYRARARTRSDLNSS